MVLEERAPQLNLGVAGKPGDDEAPHTERLGTTMVPADLTTPIEVILRRGDSILRLVRRQDPATCIQMQDRLQVLTRDSSVGSLLTVDVQPQESAGPTARLQVEDLVHRDQSSTGLGSNT